MAGSSGIYPYFDAPVAGMPEEARKAAEALEEEEEEKEEEEVATEVGHAAPAPRYSSLLMTGIPRAKKRAVLVLNESQDELDSRIAKLRSLKHEDLKHEDHTHEGLTQENGGETHPETIPADAAPETIDPFALPAMSGPLLAQKPSKQSRDLNEMFGLSALAPSPAPAAASEPSHEPAPPPAHSESPVEPGFTLLESDIEQRLRDLIAASNPPIAEAPMPAPLVASEQSAALRSADFVLIKDSSAMTAPESQRAKTIVPPVPTDVRQSLHARLWGKASAWLAKFTLRR